jgi:hypothetical protein
VISDCVSQDQPAGKNGFAVLHSTDDSGAHVEDPVQRPVTQRVLMHGCIARGNTGSGIHLGAGNPGGTGPVCITDIISAGNSGPGVTFMPKSTCVVGHGWILQGNSYNLTLRGSGHRLTGLMLDGIDRHRPGGKQSRYNIYARELSDCVLNGLVMTAAADRDVRLAGYSDTGDGLPDADVLQLLSANWDQDILYT